MVGMQITPAIGIDGVSIGDTRAAVEAAIGAPERGEVARAFYFDREPGFSVHYDDHGTVELIEVSHGEGRHEAYLGDIQLTFRLMDEVAADLARAGYSGHPVDIGVEYDEGFTVFSMASLSPSELAPGSAYDPEDERLVVEGVSIAPISYWHTDGSND